MMRSPLKIVIDHEYIPGAGYSVHDRDRYDGPESPYSTIAPRLGDAINELVEIVLEEHNKAAYHSAHLRDVEIMNKNTRGRKFATPAARVAEAEFGEDAADWILAMELGAMPREAWISPPARALRQMVNPPRLQGKSSLQRRIEPPREKVNAAWEETPQARNDAAKLAAAEWYRCVTCDATFLRAEASHVSDFSAGAIEKHDFIACPECGGAGLEDFVPCETCVRIGAQTVCAQLDGLDTCANHKDES